jgi:hypothetical protein
MFSSTQRKLAAVAALVLGSVAAKADLHFDIDVIGVELNSSTPSYSGSFDITGPGLGKGYDPVTMQIDTAYANFGLWDPIVLGGSESVTIDLGAEPFDSSGSFLGLLILGDNVQGNVLLDLDADGILNYTINRTSGSFKVLGAELHAKSSSRYECVPDSGGTLAVLSMAMVGLVAYRSKIGKGVFQA